MLEKILRAHPAEAVVGRSIPSRDVEVSELKRMVSEYPGDLIVIEEQDHRWYIIHLEPIEVSPPNAEKWIVVLPGSPLFEELRRQHSREK
jgi:hypothetical protein